MLLIQKGQKWCLWLIYTIIYIQYYVKRVEFEHGYVETRDTHIFAHNFNLIFNSKYLNPQKVLESWDFEFSIVPPMLMTVIRGQQSYFDFMTPSIQLQCYSCWRC